VQKLWSVLFGVVMLAAFLLFAVAPLVQGWWLPRNVASFGGDIDNLFYLILAITGFFFVLTEALLIWNMYRYAEEPGRRAIYVHGNHKLEVLWTIVPGAILLFLAIAQVPVWMVVKHIFTWNEVKQKAAAEARATPDVLQVEVSARQWEWRIRYPSVAHIQTWQKDEKAAEEDFLRRLPEQADDVHAVGQLHCWQGERVVVHLKTRDVIHSFFLPNLRLKQDALPGKTIPVWFMCKEYNTAPDGDRWVDGYDPATQTWAKYDPKTQAYDSQEHIWELACAEFCGARHSMMRGRLYVHKDKEDFLKGLTQAAAEQNRRQLAEAK
jgi:cytochrome c oxidase subunit 2